MEIIIENNFIFCKFCFKSKWYHTHLGEFYKWKANLCCLNLVNKFMSELMSQWVLNYFKKLLWFIQRIAQKVEDSTKSQTSYFYCGPQKNPKSG
jgi:hypothetical protein